MRMLILAMLTACVAPADAENIKGTVTCRAKAADKPAAIEKAPANSKTPAPRVETPAAAPSAIPAETPATAATPAPALPAPAPAAPATDAPPADAQPANPASPTKPADAAPKAAAPGIVVWVEGVSSAPPPKEKGQLSQKDGQFEPRLLVAVAGQTVTFPNEDNVAHNVFSLSPTQKFNLGIYPKGETKDVVFAKPGVIDVYCSLHKHMRAAIIVTPNSHFAVCKEGEPFTIGDVSPGTYKVTAWRLGYQTQTLEVVVPAKGNGEASFTLAPDAPAEPRK